MFKIVDCGSQLTQNIARRTRELGVYTEIVPYHDAGRITRDDLEGLIISGGQFSVFDNDAPNYPLSVFELEVPVLGICYGQQSIAKMFGGSVIQSKNREYGGTHVKITDTSKLFGGINGSSFKVWMSHGDIVEIVPIGFTVTSKSENGHVSSMEKGNIYTVQFHPEVDHTEYGRRILDNFVSICNAQKSWDPSKDYDRIVNEVKDKLTGRIGVGGISGGVDSTTASVLVGSLVENYQPIFVDNGLLRINEASQVMASLKHFGLNVNHVDASDRFLKKLKGIVDPDEKRRIIGHEFVSIFEEESKRIEGADYLLQGTLYPDVVESVPVYGSSDKIKRHHNVGGLPDKMGLQVYEPFRRLFKDEVRKIAGEKLNIPEDIVWRHPFPGPGLAIRIKGEVTKDKLNILRNADDIFIGELKERGLYRKINQAFVGLGGGKSVGVMGDAGTYEYDAFLRAVITDDFMTSDIYRFSWDDLQSISNRIVNEVSGVNRIFYDSTQKPPATIEWE
jgi:GMP synthase (glutamine-hydrolysing)